MGVFLLAVATSRFPPPQLLERNHIITVSTPLLPHQQDGVASFGKSKGIFAFLWTVGTGKSLTALKCLSDNNAQRVLITSDKNNTINTWSDQLAEHTDIEDRFIFVRPK